jgi:hypothetical protein
MTGLVRNGSSPWFALSFGADGSVFLMVKAQSYIPQCSFFKVTFGHDGFIAVPFEAQIDEFYVGWAPQAMSHGVERTVQVGGFVGPVLSNRRDGTWLKEVNGAVIGIDSPFRPADSFGYAVSHDKAMLFPTMIRKERL